LEDEIFKTILKGGTQGPSIPDLVEIGMGVSQRKTDAYV